VPVVKHMDRETDIPAHFGEELYADRAWRYTSAERPQITLTETVDPAVFKHLTGSPHTMATMLLTSTSIIALHAFECIHRLSTWRHGWSTSSDTHERIAYRVSLMGGANTYFAAVQGPCGT
jgi:hypothetical protein